ERVDALLDGEEPEQLVDVVRLRLVHEPVHLDRPRPRLERVREPRGIVLVDAELVEVVVGRRGLELCRRLPEALRVVAGRREWLARRGHRGALAGQEWLRVCADNPLPTAQLKVR